MFRELDEHGDIKFGTFVYSAAAVAEDVIAQIQLWLKENPFNMDEGINWADELSDYDEGRLTALIKDVAFSCANVTAISKTFKFTKVKKRVTTIEFLIVTSFSEVSQPINITV